MPPRPLFIEFCRAAFSASSELVGTKARPRRRSVRYATFQGAGPLEQTVLL
ncbi:hypothetical protein [Kitasatospora sp. NPDC093102]|uniref:hypothetical protein n=1 Tax=Kitasatospora sp. NPDC093102 TaxID=3155069 RepID=UPI0034206C7C